LIELARLANLSILDARGAPCRFEIVAGERRLRGMFADHQALFGKYPLLAATDNGR
jgi:hypothetical protein